MLLKTEVGAGTRNLQRNQGSVRRNYNERTREHSAQQIVSDTHLLLSRRHSGNEAKSIRPRSIQNKTARSGWSCEGNLDGSNHGAADSSSFADSPQLDSVDVSYQNLRKLHNSQSLMNAGTSPTDQNKPTVAEGMAAEAPSSLLRPIENNAKSIVSEVDVSAATHEVEENKATRSPQVLSASSQNTASETSSATLRRKRASRSFPVLASACEEVVAKGEQFPVKKRARCMAGTNS
ncbi:hypothetical protein BC830DRAFT_458860 [Chytriomyces sp. MP71]|nr:hypothetical protein BC830DRAFT_458860 [Chytriomyces sp. MP71]